MRCCAAARDACPTSPEAARDARGGLGLDLDGRGRPSRRGYPCGAAGSGRARRVPGRTARSRAPARESTEALLQAAVSNLPVTAGRARPHAGGRRRRRRAGSGARPGAARRISRWCTASRTARPGCIGGRPQGLAGLEDAAASAPARTARAATAGGGSSTRATASKTRIEAVRNFLAGQDFDAAVMAPHGLLCGLAPVSAVDGDRGAGLGGAGGLFRSRIRLRGCRRRGSPGPPGAGFHGSGAVALRALLDRQERLAQAEPDRADYQRDLSVSYNKMGDLYRDLGQGEQARQAYGKSLAIAERLAQAEPDRADYQRDLSVSYERWATCTAPWARGSRRARPTASRSRSRAAGAGRAGSRRLPARPLGVVQQDGRPVPRPGPGRAGAPGLRQVARDRERLAQAEPDRADYQRDLSVSYNKWATCTAPWGRASRRARPTSSRSPSRSVWRRPSRIVRTTKEIWWSH